MKLKVVQNVIHAIVACPITTVTFNTLSKRPFPDVFLFSRSHMMRSLSCHTVILLLSVIDFIKSVKIIDNGLAPPEIVHTPVALKHIDFVRLKYFIGFKKFVTVAELSIKIVA
ncbi:hypothetical protein DICVIV_03113 [Dictyocaulus viviparus]|uniref:Uncharacterized protein n=1 Tax=Dictyocaulus viviparus TaxID=29172 RepID=A0A0D8Y869_DICVI|nr:hypothetical protein DICVIV_03113 [Dictyocaulus viviparus]